MPVDTLFNEALEALLKENDGVIPGAPISFDQQIERKKEEYKEYLKFEPLQERITHALEVIQEKLVASLPENEREWLLEDLAEAGEQMVAHPEAEGEALGISNETLSVLQEFAESELKKNEIKAAVSVCTLLTVLDSRLYRHWYFLAIGLQELKEYQEAINAYSKAKEISQESPLCDLYMAECYIELADKEKAYYHLDRAKELASKSAQYEHILMDLEKRVTSEGMI